MPSMGYIYTRIGYYYLLKLCGFAGNFEIATNSENSFTFCSMHWLLLSHTRIHNVLWNCYKTEVRIN